MTADPPRAENDGRPAGYDAVAYFRLHGVPDTYYSPYREDGLEEWVGRVREAEKTAEEVWVVFDNTAAGEATGDALALKEMLEG